MQVFIRKGGSKLLSKMRLTCASHPAISFGILLTKRLRRRLQGMREWYELLQGQLGPPNTKNSLSILVSWSLSDLVVILLWIPTFLWDILDMASLVRSSITRHFRIVARHNIALSGKPAVASFVRLNSSEAPPSTKKPKTPEELQKKAALERHDDLQRDWDAKIITYEDLVPITESPTPVHLPCTHEFHGFALTSFTGHLSYWCSWAEWGRPRNDSVCC